MWHYPECGFTCCRSWGAEELAGHVFTDAFQRDQAAWDLAKSQTPLWAPFKQDFVSDQYGGLLALSAGVYRYLSPDAHRPYLIQILAALAAALGIPFFWLTVRKRWGDDVAKIASWIMVLYPESILLGSYQMREPFLISLIAIAFWALLTWPQRKVRTLIIFSGSLLGLALFSSKVALPVAGFCLLWLILSQLTRLTSFRWKVLGWISMVVVALALVGISWDWLFYRITYPILKSIHNSGFSSRH